MNAKGPEIICLYTHMYVYTHIYVCIQVCPVWDSWPGPTYPKLNIDERCNYWALMVTTAKPIPWRPLPPGVTFSCNCSSHTKRLHYTRKWQEALCRGLGRYKNGIGFFGIWKCCDIHSEVDAQKAFNGLKLVHHINFYYIWYLSELQSIGLLLEDLLYLWIALIKLFL